jgi:ubiquinol-cytochrome c reductase iron-sulfur subunit
LVDTPVQEPTRRDFLYLATGAMAAVGTVAALIPFVAQMNPDASVQALATTEVDLSAVQAGQSITVLWRGKPVFVRHRTAEEIEAARAVPLTQLVDPVARNDMLPATAPATDENRAVKPEWLIAVGVCTHLGCVPLAYQGDYHGYFCPCHGSHYDTAGRIRKGPAPQNLEIPHYQFATDTTLRIG